MMAGLLIAIVSGAQGVSKLFGLVGGSVQNNHSSNGFLFSTDSSGNALQVQYSFPVTVFGGVPANLEMVPYNGKLYGTTTIGGVNNAGTIFEYDPLTNIYTKRFDFGPNLSATGGTPRGSLLLYNNKFYGLAASYGASAMGCLFEWDPATGVYTKKFDFNNGSFPGNGPYNSLRLMNGKMYGTTAFGGSSDLGMVFEWDPATNTSVKLFELTGSNGRGFYNNVTVYNNKIYCMSHQAADNGYGALYVIDPSLPYGSNTVTIKVFDAVSGGIPNNNEMIVYNNKLYGCLSQGGANSGGSLFELDPASNTFTRLYSFQTATGRNPVGKLVLNGTKFLGLCSEGGLNNLGVIYEWDPANPATITKKVDFGPNNYDNTISPASTLVLFNSKFYATSSSGGFVNQGNLFEYDYTANTITKKLTFNAAENGRIPHGKPVLLNAKLYGVCYQGPKEIFGTPYGCLWSFDPASSTYSREFLFDDANSAANGRAPTSAPVAYNGKLYGTTTSGGIASAGVLYEFDPVTKVYVKKDMQPIGGVAPISEPTWYNNKFYGMTNAGGAGNYGIIYSYDPATATLTKLYDIQTSGGRTPSGGFTVYNDLLYGITSSGGTNNAGTIFTYDPTTNTVTTVYNLSSATGVSINNALTLYNNKLYGTSLSGGTNGRGCIFVLDPATNGVTVIQNFSTAVGTLGLDPKGELTVSGNKLYCLTQEGVNIIYVLEVDPATNIVTKKSTHTTSNSNIPVTHNGLTVVPAFIANGNPGSCETYPTIVIDGTNNNKWLPILNNSGDVVAEIKANGNSLGIVTASTYINNAAVREDDSRQLYMDRSISITTQNPVTSGAVDIRLYVKTAEYLALKNATNSVGEPSGINSINDIAILKNAQNCQSTMAAGSIKLTTVASAYEYGYVLSANVTSFSTFYFAKNTFTTLPVRLLSFAATKCAGNVCISWTVENEENLLRYEVEKMTSGNTFSKISEVPALNTSGRKSYSSTDYQPANGDNFYRLKMMDIDGRYTYSNVLRINFDKPVKVSLQPNPATDIVVVKGTDGYQQLKLVDMFGRVHAQKKITQAIEPLNVNTLPKGAYIIQLWKDGEAVSLQFIKQ